MPLIDCGEALPAILKSRLVPSCDGAGAVRSARYLGHASSTLCPRLISPKFPDPKVRALAVTASIRWMPVSLLAAICPGGERSLPARRWRSSFAAWSLAQAVGLPFYWCIASELGDVVSSYRFSVMMQQLPKNSVLDARLAYGHKPT